MYNLQPNKTSSLVPNNTPKYDISMYYLADPEKVNRIPKTAAKQMQQQVQQKPVNYLQPQQQSQQPSQNYQQPPSMNMNRNQPVDLMDNRSTHELNRKPMLQQVQQPSMNSQPYPSFYQPS